VGLAYLFGYKKALKILIGKIPRSYFIYIKPRAIVWAY
jgi:hypothetical protein